MEDTSFVSFASANVSSSLSPNPNRDATPPIAPPIRPPPIVPAIFPIPGKIVPITPPIDAPVPAEDAIRLVYLAAVFALSYASSAPISTPPFSVY